GALAEPPGARPDWFDERARLKLLRGANRVTGEPILAAWPGPGPCSSTLSPLAVAAGESGGFHTVTDIGAAPFAADRVSGEPGSRAEPSKRSRSRRRCRTAPRRWRYHTRPPRKPA